MKPPREPRWTDRLGEWGFFGLLAVVLLVYFGLAEVVYWLIDISPEWVETLVILVAVCTLIFEGIAWLGRKRPKRPKPQAQESKRETSEVDELTCCKDSTWERVRDLPGAGGFEFVLGQCGRCAAPWMNVFCVASGATGYERVKASDVEAIGAIVDADELKRYMRRWGDANL